MRSNTNVIALHERATKAKAKAFEARKLTDTAARTAQLPASGYVLIHDTEQPAFCLRLTAQGSRAWCIDKWSRDKMHRIAIAPIGDMSANEARKRAQKLIGKLHDGISPIEERRREQSEATTLEEGIKDYIAKNNLAPRTKLDYERLAENELAPWAEVKLTNITREKAREIHAEITGDTRADYALRLVRAVVLANELPNPCAKQGGRRFPWRQKSAARAARLEPSSARAAWLAFGKLPNEVAGAYFRTQLLGAMRPAEASTMTVAMVSLKGGRIDLPKTKNGQQHRIYIAPELERVLKPHLEGKKPADLVFPECDDPRKSLAMAVDALGIKFSRYDLRKLAARVAQEVGVPHPCVRQLLNHSAKTGDITGRHYAQPTESQMRDAFSRVAKFAAAGART
jgi:hypothetical protein